MPRARPDRFIWGAPSRPSPTEESGFVAEEIAYVGDRVDNDIRPAIEAGMLAVHIRRGPWGHLFDVPPRAFRILDLSELPEALAGA